MTERFAERKKLLEGGEPGFEGRGLPPHILEDADSSEEFEVESDSFAVILGGKDGKKARFGRLVEAGEIFHRIDGTPMRRREMGS